jgi:hypothetical protein
MDQGGNNNASTEQHEDTSFNLYDTYGTDMDDDAAAHGEGEFPLGGAWDHHHIQSADEAGYPQVETGYDNTTTPMDDFVTTHYGHEFQPGQVFDHDGHPFQDFMVQSDQHHTENEGFDLNAMDLYNVSSIYPNLAQENADYGRSY